MPPTRIILRLAAALALAASLAGCSSTWVGSQYQQSGQFATWVDTPSTKQYVLQPGDDVAVILPFNAEMNQDSLVAPDGTFTMPLVGALPAAGHTANQFADDINKVLAAKGLVADARASVRVVKSGAQVYVDGQVGKPGAVPLDPNMTVMQAIAAANGMRDTARTDEIVLIRRSPVDGRPMLRTIDIDALTHKGDPDQAVILQASDTVFVPKSSIAEVDQWVDQHLNQAVPFSKSLGYSYNTNPTNN